jgi:hypothetical protein
MLRRVPLVRTDVSEELSASFYRVTRIANIVPLVTANVPSSPILVALMMEAILSSETSVLTSLKMAFFKMFLYLTTYIPRGNVCYFTIPVLIMAGLVYSDISASVALAGQMLLQSERLHSLNDSLLRKLNSLYQKEFILLTLKKLKLFCGKFSCYIKLIVTALKTWRVS